MGLFAYVNPPPPFSPRERTAQQMPTSRIPRRTQRTRAIKGAPAHRAFGAREGRGEGGEREGEGVVGRGEGREGVRGRGRGGERRGEAQVGSKKKNSKMRCKFQDVKSNGHSVLRY